MDIRLERFTIPNKNFLELVSNLDSELAVIDGDDHAFYDQYNRLNGIRNFVILYSNDLPVACGTFKHFTDNTYEIKRMYTLPGFRGKGYATMILEDLEKWAFESGCDKIILETGRKQENACRLYSRNGYRVMENFGPYVDVDNSICFYKYLKHSEPKFMELDFNIILEDDRAKLEPMDWCHFEPLLEIAIKHPDLLDYSPPSFGSEETLRAYFTHNLDLKSRKEKCPFVIFDKKNDAYAGSTSFMNISSIDKRLEIGSTWLAKEFQRTGLNRHCKYLLLSYAFETLQFERVELKTDSRNIQSRKAIEAIGATYEGTLRSHMLLSDGHRRDTVYYSILKSEWPEIRATVFNTIAND